MPFPVVVVAAVALAFAMTYWSQVGVRKAVRGESRQGRFFYRLLGASPPSPSVRPPRRVRRRSTALALLLVAPFAAGVFIAELSGHHQWALVILACGVLLAVLAIGLLALVGRRDPAGLRRLLTRVGLHSDDH